MVDDITEKTYNAFMINRGLSQYHDTILFANEMNYRYHLPYRLQYDFFLKGIKKRKRWSKWPKKDKEHKYLNDVKKFYNYSNEKAKAVLNVLTEDDLKEIHKKMDPGGRK